MKKIDLNCDLGEGYNDVAIMPYISSCNIACGGHVGDNKTIDHTIKLAIKHGVAIGAHPSYPDKENFGRKTMDLPYPDLVLELGVQIRKVLDNCNQKKIPLHHIKPHGALYNDICSDTQLAKVFIEYMAQEFSNIPLYLMANSHATKLAMQQGLRVYHEAFADRVYSDNGRLQSRAIKGAVLQDSDDIITQLNHLTQGKIIDVNNMKHELAANTICIHSDTNNSAKLASEINQHLKSKGIDISADK